MQYDGTNRRIVKAVANSGDWEVTYHYYWNSQRMIEKRNGSDELLDQYVWGLGYIDEVAQIAVNAFDDCPKVDHWFCLMQDANYNVLRKPAKPRGTSRARPS